MKWEYCFYVPDLKVDAKNPSKSTVDFTMEAMNKFGTDEWEAVGFWVSADHGSGAILFKRPLRAPEDQLFTAEQRVQP